MQKPVKFLLHLKEDYLAYSFLVFGFFFRLFYIFRFTTPQMYLWSDPGYYDLRALDMAKGQFVMFSTYWPPFFHIFLSFIYRPLVWLGIESWRIKIDMVLFALFYIIGFWCIYQIVKKLFDKKIALVILGILIFWYPLIFLNYVIMSENLFFPLMFLGLYVLIVKGDKPINGALLGILWGTAFLARPVFALAIPLFVLWALYYKINWRFLISFLLTGAVIVALMMGFNYYYTKNDIAGGTEKSISSNGGVGFAMLWCDAKSIEFRNNGYNFGFGPPANINYEESKRIFTDVPFSNQKYYYQMGLDCLKERPEKLITNFSSVIKLFHSHLFPTIGNVAYWENFRLLFKFLTGFLFLTSIISLIFFTRNKYLYLMALIILSLPMMVYLQNVGEERYIIPYAPLLLILSAPLAISLNKNKKIDFNPAYMAFLSILILISFIFRYSFLNVQSGDYIYWLSPWYDFIKLHGISAFKYGFSNYTPLYTYFLGFFAILPINKLYAIKFLSIFFEFILAFFVFLTIRKKYPNNLFIPLLAFTAVLIAPTVIINGAYWAQCDVIYTCFLVASVYFLLKGKPFLSLMLYGVAFALKLQAIFLLPLFIILLFKNKIKIWHFLSIPIVYFLTILPSAILGRPLKDLFLIYFNQAKDYNYLSLNAPSWYQWFSAAKFETLYLPGLLIALISTLIFIFFVSKALPAQAGKKEMTNDNIIKIAFLSAILLPFLLPKMHERFFFPADIFSIIFAFYFPKYFLLPLFMQMISFLSYGPFLWGKSADFPLLAFGVLAIILAAGAGLFFENYFTPKNKEIAQSP